MRRWRVGLVLVCLAVAALAPAHVSGENLGPGGGSRVIAGDEMVGPYRLFITSAPEPAQVGMVTYVVRITDPKTNETVKDADVHVSLTLADPAVALEDAVTHANSGNPVDYAAHIQMAQPGQYDGLIRVQGAAGSAEVRFVQRVLAPRGTSTLLVLALPFVVGLGVLGGLWYFRSGSRKPARP